MKPGTEGGKRCENVARKREIGAKSCNGVVLNYTHLHEYTQSSRAEFTAEAQSQAELGTNIGKLGCGAANRLFPFELGG